MTLAFDLIAQTESPKKDNMPRISYLLTSLGQFHLKKPLKVNKISPTLNQLKLELLLSRVV